MIPVPTSAVATTAAATLQTYVPPKKPLNKLGANVRKSATALPAVLEEESLPKAVHDNVFISTNHASAVLVKRTGQADLAATMLADNKKLQQELAPVAAPTVKARKPVAPVKAGDVVEPTPPALSAPIAPERVTLDAKDALQGAHSLEHYKRRDEDLALFAGALIQRANQRPTNDMITQTPPVVGVLQYCAKFKDSEAWYKPMSAAIADHPELSFPDTPLMTRAILTTFMREADPRATYERPCFNLDRDPMEHEGRARCIAHVMSEAMWGKDRAFRLRELLFENQNIKINAALEAAASTKAAQDPRDFLSPVPQLCYMCHVWMTTEACLNQKNRLAKDPSDADDDIVILNRFMVDIDKEGEYDRRAMLASDDVGLGIWGPFPLWNERNYIPVVIASQGNLRGFQESDALLFRLPRAALLRIGSESVKGSTLSTPMSVAPADSTIRQ